MCLQEPLEIKHRILKFRDHDCIHEGLYCVFSQKCTNKWERVKNGVIEKKWAKNCKKKLNMEDKNPLYMSV